MISVFDTSVVRVDARERGAIPKFTRVDRPRRPRGTHEEHEDTGTFVTFVFVAKRPSRFGLDSGELPLNSMVSTQASSEPRRSDRRG